MPINAAIPFYIEIYDNNKVIVNLNDKTIKQNTLFCLMKLDQFVFLEAKLLCN